MSIAAILNYPEFVIAAVLSVLYFLNTRRQSGISYVPSWLSDFATSVLSMAPARYVTWLNQMQNYAGWRNNTAFGALASYKIYPSALLLLTGIFLPIPAAIVISVAAFFVADIVLTITSRRRQQEIRDALPSALDLMVLCADAGLGLDATLQRIATEKTSTSHPLNEELMILGRDIVLGMDRERAYQELYNRTGVEELKSFASSLNQSSRLGLSIAKILRNQADFQRTKLSQKAEERSARLPVYMAFPLWFCIMPALMVILLAPSLIVFFLNSPHPAEFVR